MNAPATLRPSGRAPNELRALKFERGYTQHAEGSVLVAFGATRVLCTASIEESVPGFLRGQRGRPRAPLHAQFRPRLGDGRVRHAAARHAHPR